MQAADSTARTARPSEEAILRTLERLAQRERRRASGFYAVGDALPPSSRQPDSYAGIDRLDRSELDETDDG